MTNDAIGSSKAGEGDRTLDINLGKDRTAIPSDAINRLTSSQEAVCTSVCTSEPETVKVGGDNALAADPLAMIAAGITKLSEADRKRLLAMLTASLGGGT